MSWVAECICILKMSGKSRELGLRMKKKTSWTAMSHISILEASHDDDSAPLIPRLKAFYPNNEFGCSMLHRRKDQCSKTNF